MIKSKKIKGATTIFQTFNALVPLYPKPLITLRALMGLFRPYLIEISNKTATILHMNDTFEIKRNHMVDIQLIPRGIRDGQVLRAMRKIPRHAFVPASLQVEAYADCALPIGEGQTISQPYMVAIMTELLNLEGTETVLEIGTGSGYQTAILCELAKKVISVERIKILADNARDRLNNLDYQNFEIININGAHGYAKLALYDRILVTAAAPEIPRVLIDQLKEGGRLIIPVGEPYLQELTIVDKVEGKIIIKKNVGCVFVPLISG